MLHLEYDITGLRGAEYNPRRIDQDDLDKLAESIRTLGLVKPLIARGDLLVAGHQRTKALRHIGVTRAPVYVLPCETTTYDEVRFNQLHNGTDMDCGEERAVIEGGFDETGYQVIEGRRVTGNFRCPMAVVRAEITDLIRKFGPWGGVVATQSGKIIHCAQYALAAALTRTPLTCYVIPDEREAEYSAFLNRQYGVFSYDGLARDTYIQTFAQMMRLRNDDGDGKQSRSTLYEGHVIPWLQKNRGAVVLDVGAGQGDYAARLRRQGYAVHDLEFFRRVSGRQAIDVGAVNRMIDRALAQVDAGGYDAVVCDSVMNSVDSLQAEQSVMVMLNAFAKAGAPIFFSGRKAERIGNLYRMTKATDGSRYVEFLDADGFSALYRKGRWFYQKFHTAAQVDALIERAGLQPVLHDRKASTTSWQAVATKARALPLQMVEQAVEFEFNLPVSDTRTLNRHTDAMRVFRGNNQ